MPLLIIAAGGTGGHMFPAQALAEQMLARGWRVVLSTDARGARYADGFPPEVERRVVGAATFARGGVVAKLIAPLRIALGVLSAIRDMRRDPPACVAGFGGYPAFPAMAAAWLLRRPRLIHEANGVLGKVNEVFATRVDRVACGVWPTELPKGARAVHTGNPVRSAVAAAAGAPYPDMDGPLRLLAVGGSQGATIVAKTVPAALALLPADLRGRITVAQQARDADQDEAVAAYAGMGVEAEVSAFFADMADRLCGAHLVITRSGASTVADLACVGRPSILIPLAIAIRGEQAANARGLAETGGAVVIEESALTPEALSEHIAAILTDPARARSMAAAARAQGRPDAAGALADLVESLV